jgi:hypothetical protein
MFYYSSHNLLAPGNQKTLQKQKEPKTTKLVLISGFTQVGVTPTRNKGKSYTLKFRAVVGMSCSAVRAQYQRQGYGGTTDTTKPTNCGLS